MKRLIAAALAMLIIAGLAACGEKGGDDVTDTPANSVNQPAPADTSVGQGESTADAFADNNDDVLGNSADAAGDDGDTEDDNSQLQQYVGKPVDELISAIGSPNASEYQDSCEYPDTQDGFLYYDGFTVVTLKNSDGETVRSIR